MKKCLNCGQEFEGNFCPNCGAEYSDVKTCPKCGAQLSSAAKFCNQCGYSFEEAKKGNAKKAEKKPNKFIVWIKSHLKIAIPAASLLVVAIVLCSLIPVFISAKTNGSYYKANYKGELDRENYIVLSNGKWHDSDENSGNYKINNGKVTFYSTFMGETMVVSEGTVKNGILAVDAPGSADIFVSDKHKHSYDEIKATQPSTCLSEGVGYAKCVCGDRHDCTIEKSGHS